MSEEPGEGSGETRHRLDPDRAAQIARRRPGRRGAAPTVDTRRYQRIIGVIGLVLVLVVSIAFLGSHHPGSVGVPAGQHLPLFAAPLAASNLNGDARLNPPCTLAQHDPRALNICLLVKQAPLVLAFFVTDSGSCEAQVTALQAVAHRFRGRPIHFAAVAVHTSHQDAAAAVRANHWTIPVAYDADGAVGAAYGVAICPIVQLAERGGLVQNRLRGEHWNDVRALTGAVRALLSKSGGA